MGVTTNKQNATALESAAHEYKRLKGISQAVFDEKVRALEEESDPLGALLKLWAKVDKNIKAMKPLVKEQGAGTNTRHAPGANDASKQATNALEVRLAAGEGKPGTSDEFEAQGQTPDPDLLSSALQVRGLEQETAQRVATEAIGSALKFVWVEAPLAGSSFFETYPDQGKIIVAINKSHEAYEWLISVLEGNESDGREGPTKEQPGSPATLQDRLDKAVFSLQLLLMAWARMEDEAEGDNKRRIQRAREDWGRIASRFLDSNDNSVESS